MGEHLAVEAGMIPPAQERRDLLGREVDRGVVQQAWVQAGECLTAGEDQVGGEFRLVDDPVISNRLSRYKYAPGWEFPWGTWWLTGVSCDQPLIGFLCHVRVWGSKTSVVKSS